MRCGLSKAEEGEGLAVQEERTPLDLEATSKVLRYKFGAAPAEPQVIQSRPTLPPLYRNGAVLIHSLTSGGTKARLSRVEREREKIERFTSKYPHYFVGTLQPR